jgi:hypothetical protein
MPADVDHILLTRFNLPSEGAESFVRRREGWLRSRVELFERYCLPSVEKQTATSFHWIIYFDPQSPEWLKSRVKHLARNSSFVPIYRARVSPQELLQDLRDVSGAQHRKLMTTNLDNDDGLSSDFVQRLHDVPTGANRTAVYLVRGLIRSGNRVYLRTDRSNAFCSVREEWDSAQTCWATWHNLLGKSMDVVRVGGDPAWLQVIHGSNVSNRTKGRRISAEGFQQSFGTLLDGAEDLGRGALLKDLLIHRPGRSVRDLSRSTIKQAAFSVMGQDGLDRFKEEWASHSLKRNKVPDERSTGIHRSPSGIPVRKGAIDDASS